MTPNVLIEIRCHLKKKRKNENACKICGSTTKTDNVLDGVGDEHEHIRNLQTAKSTFAPSDNT